LEKLEKEGLIEKPFQRKQLKIRFPERGRSGRTVLAINNLKFGFGDKVRLFYISIPNSFDPLLF
jgi:ATPase subunit of ABC transporter with duplicated ATPase domains